MEPRIEKISEKKLIGKRLKMTLSNDRTSELWQSFMPDRKEIKNNLSADLFCLQIFDEFFDFKDFNQDTEFEKWAAVEVSDFNKIPVEMKTRTLKGGMYAVFIHKGLASDFHKTFQFIFSSWLPKSEYELDQREHFELLGDKYKNNDPSSEEEVWIPIKRKE
ncbi:MAG: GyrI-like domain-containing protein [Bacteroidota bacterium]|nr:GyrI-like domain-containing protein [Bacteroidota bacterium]